MEWSQAVLTPEHRYFQHEDQGMFIYQSWKGIGNGLLDLRTRQDVAVTIVDIATNHAPEQIVDGVESPRRWA